MSYVVGIDLGTSNTCVSVVLDGEPRIVTDERGRSTTPSVLALNRDGKFLVGHLAKAQMVTNPYGTICSAKRLIGQKFSSNNVQQALRYLPFNVVQAPDGAPLCEIGGRRLTPVDVAVAVIKKVKRLAERALDEEITQAVITVPAHFDNSQRRETKRAAERAGLEVLRLINEPTAAALAYGYGSGARQTIAVYDYGGGTFDISILEIGENVFEVLSTGGDSYLGGDDFNQRIANYLAKHLKETTGVDIAFDRMAMQRLLDAAELAKVRLSTEESTEIRLNRVAPNVDQSVNLYTRLTRDQVEDMCIDLVERSLEICDKTFESARVGLHEIDKFILVGGMTRMPLIRRLAEEYFGQEAAASVNPDEVVATGASIQAATLVDPQEEVLLLDVTPLTLGIRSLNDIFTPIIKQNTKVPHRVSKRFTTSRDNQDRVRIEIYQGEERYCKDNTLLGEFDLVGISQAPRMVPQIDVTFKIDANGILSVTARDQASQAAESIQIVDMAKRALDDVLGHETEDDGYGVENYFEDPDDSPSFDY